MNSEKNVKSKESETVATFTAHVYFILFFAAITLFLLWGIKFITLEFLIISLLVLIGIDAIYTACILIGYSLSP